MVESPGDPLAEMLSSRALPPFCQAPPLKQPAAPGTSLQQNLEPPPPKNLNSYALGVVHFDPSLSGTL